MFSSTVYSTHFWQHFSLRYLHSTFCCHSPVIMVYSPHELMPGCFYHLLCHNCIAQTCSTDPSLSPFAATLMSYLLKGHPVTWVKDRSQLFSSEHIWLILQCLVCTGSCFLWLRIDHSIVIQFEDKLQLKHGMSHSRPSGGSTLASSIVSPWKSHYKTNTNSWMCHLSASTPKLIRIFLSTFPLIPTTYSEIHPNLLTGSNKYCIN